ncbi:MAG TPA: four helix bundle protein [bacterium]|jgi:four helix bundle protein
MPTQRELLSERFLNFAAAIIDLADEQDKNASSRHVLGQLIRSATSTGANYEESRSAESRQDFIHKMQIVLKELRETGYWLKLLSRSKRQMQARQKLDALSGEAEELTRIVAKSVVTAKSKNV